jgi:Uncharacterized conserved protein
MSEEIVAEQPNEEQPEVNEVQLLKQQLADAQKAIEAISAKKEELLKETKQAKEEKRRQAEEAEKARQEKLVVAEKNGEYEKLWKQAQEDKQNLEKQLQQDRKERREEKINLDAIKIANDLAKGDAYKAELLSTFIASSISKIADEYGRADADVLASVRQQFETDKKYAPLLGGNQSAGGGAPGNQRSAPKTNEITRADFEKMNDVQRAQHFKKGGKITD